MQIIDFQFFIKKLSSVVLILQKKHIKTHLVYYQ